MPELPEVEVVLRQLKPQLLGTQVHTLDIFRQDIVRRGHQYLSWFPSSIIHDVTRRGKCLIITCRKSGEICHFLSELGMTGLWLYHPTFVNSPEHLHARLTFSGTSEKTLFYWNPRRFGRLWLLPPPELEHFLKRRYGPDALEIDEPTFTQLIRSSRGQMKSWLLNQQKVAGIGNIYANEILFRAGVHPKAKGCALTKSTCKLLFETLKSVLEEAIQSGGSSIRDFQAPNGSQGRFQEAHQVYQKTGRPCPRGCHAVIKRMKGERSSFYCPTCQKHR